MSLTRLKLKLIAGKQEVLTNINSKNIAYYSGDSFIGIRLNKSSQTLILYPNMSINFNDDIKTVELESEIDQNIVLYIGDGKIIDSRPDVLKISKISAKNYRFVESSGSITTNTINENLHRKEIIIKSESGNIRVDFDNGSGYYLLTANETLKLTTTNKVLVVNDGNSIANVIESYIDDSSSITGGIFIT